VELIEKLLKRQWKGMVCNIWMYICVKLAQRPEGKKDVYLLLYAMVHQQVLTFITRKTKHNGNTDLNGSLGYLCRFD